MRVIKSALGTPVSIDGDDDGVAIRVEHYDGSDLTRAVDRADFLAAVRDLGVIVIDKADLPDVGHSHTAANDDDVWAADDGARMVVPYSERADMAAWVRRHSLRWLALAEHLDASPPVDEAQVEALAGIIRDEETERHAQGDSASWFDIARRLLATGRIEVKP